MTKKYGVELKEQLVHAFMQGTSYLQLEKEYGVAKSTISGWVKMPKKKSLLKHTENIRKLNSSHYVRSHSQITVFCVRFGGEASENGSTHY